MNILAQLPRLMRVWGIDRAIAYTVIARGWSVLAGPISLFLIATHLSSEEQGFYYTFASVLGLQIFFDLGLSFVVLQFASHERALLEWTAHGTLEGDLVAKARLASLLRRALTWYGAATVLSVTTMLPIGLMFFGRHQPTGAPVSWQLPWLAVVVVSAGNLLISPVLALLEGCGLVAEIALLRICQAVTGSLLAWLILLQHGRLFTAPVLNMVGLLWGLGWCVFRRRAFLADLVTFRHGAVAIQWWREVWPFQWKIALSGVSGYFIFVLFNPVLFAFHGAIAAGQMGMSITVLSTLSTMALAWVSTKSAPFGTLIAKRDFKSLDRMFFPALWQSFAVVAIGGVALWLVVFSLHSMHHPLSQRLLAPLPLGLLVATAVMNHIVSAEAVYLRAHKQEPFLIISVLIGCLIGLSTYFLGKYFAATGMMAGAFVITLVFGLGVGSWIFIRKRRAWRDDAATVVASSPYAVQP